jgi:hypothetical protein
MRATTPATPLDMIATVARMAGSYSVSTRAHPGSDWCTLLP